MSIGAAALCALFIIEGGLLLLIHVDAAYISFHKRTAAISRPPLLTSTPHCSRRQSHLPCP